MKKAFGIPGLFSALFLSGCIIVVNTDTGLCPKEEFRVGGGLAIDYRAPEDGRAILVDKRSGKTIKTESLSEGEVFSFEVSQEEKEYYRGLGVDLKKADFVLYFYPKNVPVDLLKQPGEE